MDEEVYHKMKVTNNGNLRPINDCSITIPSGGSFNQLITLNNLPDISDSKSAVYNGEGIIGRSSPLHTYSHSAERTINMQLHFFIVRKGDAEKNLGYLRAIQSAVYPRSGKGFGGDSTPYKPPPICKIKCGKILGDGELCVILQSYSVKFPTEVAWDEETFCPYRFDVDTNWIVVYTSENLPFQDQIIKSGR